MFPFTIGIKMNIPIIIRKQKILYIDNCVVGR